jgi:hypothetical protein
MLTKSDGTKRNEGVESSTPEKLPDYDWGRTKTRKSVHWENGIKKTALWICPECGKHHTKLSGQKKANRYWPLRGKCDHCKWSTRNLTPHVDDWYEIRKDARKMADRLNLGRFD